MYAILYTILQGPMRIMLVLSIKKDPINLAIKIYIYRYIYILYLLILIYVHTHTHTYTRPSRYLPM